MDTLAFVRRQKEIDAAVKAGDFPHAFELVDDLQADSPLTAVQEKLLSRSLDLIQRKSQRSSAVAESAPFSNSSSSGSQVRSRDSASGRRHARAPLESEALSALEAIELRAATQVSGLLRQLPPDELSDQIARRVLELQRENLSLNQRLSQRMTAVERPTQVITPMPDEVIGMPMGPRTRIIQRREEVEKAALERGPELPLAMQGPQNVVNPAFSERARAVQHHHEHGEDHDGSGEHFPIKPSPASLRRAPTISPPPEHMEPMPPPPNWLLDPSFKKLSIIIPIVLILVLGIFVGPSLLGGSATASVEARLASAPPSIGGYQIGDSYSSAVKAFAALEANPNATVDSSTSVALFPQLGVRLTRAEAGDTIKEIQITARQRTWPLFLSSAGTSLTLGAPMDLEAVKSAMAGANFAIVGSQQDATQTAFIRNYGTIRATIVYQHGDNNAAGRITALALRRIGS